MSVKSIDPTMHLACLRLLVEAVPLALQKLHDGAVSSDCQQGFWWAVRDLEEYFTVTDSTDDGVGCLHDSFLRSVDQLGFDIADELAEPTT